jgi:ribosome modulation factor
MYIIKLKHDRYAHIAGRSKNPCLFTKEGVDKWLNKHGNLWVESIEEVKVYNKNWY